MLLVIAFTINRRAIEAVRNPSPAIVQAGIKVMLMSIVIMDSTLVFWYLTRRTEPHTARCTRWQPRRWSFPQ